LRFFGGCWWVDKGVGEIVLLKSGGSASAGCMLSQGAAKSDEKRRRILEKQNSCREEKIQLIQLIQLILFLQL